MKKEDIIQNSIEFVENSPNNYITQKIALDEKVVGMQIYEAPIFAFGDPEDEYFSLLKEASIIGEHYILPKEWLPTAKTVISFFLPFSDSVKQGNMKEKIWPSKEWLHARIEGQQFINKLCLNLVSFIEEKGYECTIPSMDKRFWVQAEGDASSRCPDTSFTSNWSERHTAYICGLGTFGLSKGLITSKGMAGRFGSIITNLDLPVDTRKYNKIHEYCTLCGACIENCPVNAISFKDGKDHLKCSRFLDKTIEKFKPRYGCGKCQVGVPCESQIPYKE